MIRIKTIHMKRVTKTITRPLLKNKLYVPGWEFEKWFINPREEIYNGWIISLVYLYNYKYPNGIPIGLGIIKLYDLRYNKEAGLIGFFIKKRYRKRGYACQLAKKLEEQLLRKYPNEQISIFATGKAVNICKTFKTITCIEF